MTLVRTECGHCGLGLLDGELVVFEQGALFHRPCLRVAWSSVLSEDSQEDCQGSKESVEAGRKAVRAQRKNRSARGRSVIRLIGPVEPDR
jgi:hypothetical protein